MANFDYEAYLKQKQEREERAERKATGTDERVKTRFMGEFFKESDSVVVRFPYESMADVKFETTHTVDYPGSKFKKRVRCTGDATCPFCGKDVAKEDRVKVETRFFVKALVYVQEGTKIMCYPTIWDRAAAFAEMDLASLIEEYGNLKNVLVRIRKTGTGLDTRYTLTPMSPSHVVFNESTCPADFTQLDQIDPCLVLTKTVDQYLAAVNGETVAETKVEAAPTVTEQKIVEQKPISVPEEPVSKPAVEKEAEPTAARPSIIRIF